jgi:predicted MPP superfamily phosphohydrolase
MKSFSFRERQVQKIASQLNPSLIAYTGDLIHTESGIDGFLQLAKSIPSQHGAFAIYGNSEHKNGVESDKLTKILDSNGINVLVNDNQAISLGGEKIYICGVDDPTTWFDDIEKSFRGIPSESFKLLLMHNPDNIAQAAFYESDFVLSGHTHGGQVRLPLIGAPFTHSLYGVAMSSGYYGEKRLRKIVGRSPGCTQLYVSRGIGLSGANIRFLCRPEITLITLRSLMSKK